MTKFLSLLIYFLLCVSLTACVKTNELADAPSVIPESTAALMDVYLPTYQTPDTSATWQDNSQALQSEPYQPYGEPVACPKLPFSEDVTYTCHIPETRYTAEGTRARYEETDTGIRIMMGKTESNVASDDLSSVAEEICLPILAEDYNTLAPNTRTNHTIQAEACESVTINDREMVKLRARLSYNNEGVTERVRMIVYVCQLSNGRCAYWSAGYIEGEMYLEVKSIAMNMAQSFTEVT